MKYKRSFAFLWTGIIPFGGLFLMLFGFQKVSQDNSLYATIASLPIAFCSIIAVGFILGWCAALFKTQKWGLVYIAMLTVFLFDKLINLGMMHWGAWK